MLARSSFRAPQSVVLSSILLVTQVSSTYEVVLVFSDTSQQCQRCAVGTALVPTLPCKPSCQYKCFSLSLRHGKKRIIWLACVCVEHWCFCSGMFECVSAFRLAPPILLNLIKSFEVCDLILPCNESCQCVL